jgi:GT2 family glycosyltransferase
MTAIALSPEAGVERRGGHFMATSTEPWLVIGHHAALRPGQIVELVYRMSLWDEPARPVLRFWRADGDWLDQIAPGPVAGAALWTGRIPAGTIRISISPTSRLGRFDFALEAISATSFGALLAQGLRRRPGAALRALVARLAGQAAKSDAYLATATRMAPMAQYEAWRRERARPIDLEGIDAPRCDWTRSPTIDLIADATNAQSIDLVRLIAALRAQIYPRWRLRLAADQPLQDLPDDPRIACLRRESIAAFLRAAPDDGLIGAVAMGDALYPYALAMIAEAAARFPQAQILYGDEDDRRASQKRPILKPGWSPALQAQRPYLGHALFLRPQVIADWTEADLASFAGGAELPPGFAKGLAPGMAHSLRRVLLTRARPWPDRDLRPAAPASALGPPAKPAAPPAVLIIIPARDQALALSRCVASIFARTAFNNFSIIIVDNGGVEPATQALFEKFRGDRIVSVLRCPGPFNHSALCNAAAARRKADVLVFLSNAAEIVSADWLHRLVAHALSPEAGAVGGIILDQAGRIQDPGIALGRDDDFPPFGAGAPMEAPGWLSRNETVHEVSAVGKACLAVARRKFMLVGGFDADHLPFEHNDVDLCLRLAERGWTSRIDPKIRISRLGPARPAYVEVDLARRRWFRTRWLEILRDDPFFHPGLSLAAAQEELN